MHPHLEGHHRERHHLLNLLLQEGVDHPRLAARHPVLLLLHLPVEVLPLLVPLQEEEVLPQLYLPVAAQAHRLHLQRVEPLHLVKCSKTIVFNYKLTYS